MGASETRCVGRRQMYKSFRVKNFRCFKDLQINDLGRVNLIAGKNNTGKTALLEAMYLHTRPLTPFVLFQLQQARGLELPKAYISRYWKQFFYNQDSSQTIDLEAKRNSWFTSYLSISEILDNKENANAINEYIIRTERSQSVEELYGSFEDPRAILRFSYTWTQAGETHKVYFGPDLLTDSVKEYEDQSVFVSVQGRPDQQKVAEQLSQLEISGSLNGLIMALQILEPNVRDLRLLSPFGEPNIWVSVTGNDNPIPLKLMGEGINRFCNISMSMTPDIDYLFIDEIENGIHHSVQCDVWKAIGQVARDQDIQIFATTHSLEMIRAAYEAFSEVDKLDEFRFHRLYRSSKTDEIGVATYNELDLDAVATFDFDYEVRG